MAELQDNPVDFASLDAKQVWEWRRQAALDAGLSEECAEVLANGEIDAHAIRDLHRRGCPPLLIFDLLA